MEQGGGGVGTGAGRRGKSTRRVAAWQSVANLGGAAGQDRASSGVCARGCGWVGGRDEGGQDLHGNADHTQHRRHRRPNPLLNGWGAAGVR